MPESLKNVSGFESEFTAWMDQRKSNGKKASERAKTLLLGKLAERPQQAIKAVAACIERNWAGFEWAWIDRDQQPVRGGRYAPKVNPPKSEGQIAFDEMCKKQEADRERERRESGVRIMPGMLTGAVAGLMRKP
jgi:hypothetical protein